MKRIISGLALMALVAVTSSAVVSASTHRASKNGHGVHARLASNAQCSDPAHCTVGSCSRGTSASAAAVTASATRVKTQAKPLMMNGVVCPVSDPSKCPASCPRHSAGAATATVVTGS